MDGRDGCQQDNDLQKSARLNSDSEHLLGAGHPNHGAKAPSEEGQNENCVTKNGALAGRRRHFAMIERSSPRGSL